MASASEGQREGEGMDWNGGLVRIGGQENGQRGRGGVTAGVSVHSTGCIHYILN